MVNISDRVERALNTELARRLLIQYFCEKGFAENFDRRVYPPTMQDLVESIPQLNGKLEIIPHAIEINPQNGFARMGWNLFVLGNQRMYLGETEHTDLRDLANQLDNTTLMFEEDETNIVFRQGRSARDIVEYILRVMSRSDAGIIRSSENMQPAQGMPFGAAGRNSFYDRPKTIRPEGSSIK